MKVLLTGATGFVGKHLCKALVADGHSLVVLSRNPAKVATALSVPAAPVAWQPERESLPKEALTGVEAVIHLAGEGIAEKRWSKKQKEKIYQSRVLGTRNLMEGIRVASERPSVVISASAIGFYGDRADEVLYETSSPGSGFQAEVCRDWERELFQSKIEGTRLVAIRIGIVMGREGGALKKLLPLFKTGLGGPVGNGNQWMSWIHIQDLVGIFLLALKTPTASTVREDQNISLNTVSQSY